MTIPLPSTRRPLPAGIDSDPTTYDTASQVFAINTSSDWLFADFGFPATSPADFGSIGDTVFLDLDGDGAQDADEDGLEGVTVVLLDNSGTEVATTTTDSSGEYDFVGLAAGDYQVQVTDVDGVLVGLNLSAGSTNPTAVISITAGQDFNSANFPYAPGNGVGTVGDLVWHDKNDNGLFEEATESGIEGVTVQLWLDTNDNTVAEPGVDNLLRTTATDANGSYLFTGLPAGDYLVTVTDVEVVLDGLRITIGSTGLDDNSQANPDDVEITNSRAPNDLTSDFGFTVAGTPYEASGTVFFDNDGGRHPRHRLRARCCRSARSLVSGHERRWSLGLGGCRFWQDCC